MPPTLREMAAATTQQPQRVPPTNAAQNGDGDGSADDGAGSGQNGNGQQRAMTPEQLYNENRKLQRLLGKQKEEIAGLRGEIDPLKQSLGKFNQFAALFGGKEQPVPEGAKKPKLSERAKALHDAVIANDPESGGIPLTLDMAGISEQAFELVQTQAKKIEELEAQLKMVQSPQHAAEGQMFVSIDGHIRDALEEFLGDAALAEENYDDFEKEAIKKLKELKADRKKWARFLSGGQSVWQQFAQAVVQGKYGGKLVRKGAQAVEEYSIADAQADQERCKTMEAGPERAALFKKARQRLLPEMLGLKFA